MGAQMGMWFQSMIELFDMSKHNVTKLIATLTLCSSMAIHTLHILLCFVLGFFFFLQEKFFIYLISIMVTIFLFSNVEAYIDFDL